MMKLVKLIMVSVFLTMTSFSGLAVGKSVSINGAGATFPHPVYAKWAEKYSQETGNKVNYQAIGSGGGIRQITARTVDFGATDAPLNEVKLNKEDMIQFPMVMGAIVPVVNIPGVKPGALKLTGEILADIYMGKIKKWNDKRITRINQGLDIPGQAIYVVHRSDGSGTTYNFSHYLSLVSENWKNQVGVNTDLTWPKAATTIGANGNAGVANFVRRTRGAIGYVEFAFAKQNNLVHTQLASAEGVFLQPNMKTFQSAASNADWSTSSNFELLLNNQPGSDSWPITAATFILLHKDQASAERIKQMLDFFSWSYENGDALAEELDFIPMPKNVVKLVENTWKKNLTHKGKPIVH